MIVGGPVGGAVVATYSRVPRGHMRPNRSRSPYNPAHRCAVRKGSDQNRSSGLRPETVGAVDKVQDRAGRPAGMVAAMSAEACPRSRGRQLSAGVASEIHSASHSAAHSRGSSRCCAVCRIHPRDKGPPAGPFRSASLSYPGSRAACRCLRQVQVGKDGQWSDP